MKNHRLILHPFLFGAYPVLALLAANVDQVAPGEALRPLLVTLTGALLLLGLFRLLLKDWERAGLLASLVLVLFFSYGHIYHLAENAVVGGVLIGRHRLLLAVWLLLLAAGSLWIIRARRLPAALTGFLNIVAAAALVLPVYTMLTFFTRAASAAPAPQASAPAAVAPQAAAATGPSGTRRRPDIYYIILDAYARQDVLRLLYGYDNSPFLDYLRGRGFFVAGASRSNYDQTYLSIPSSLNMNFVEAFAGPLDPESDDMSRQVAALKDSLVRRKLEALGYQTVAFDTGWYGTEIRDADLYLSSGEQVSSPSGASQPFARLGQVSAFEIMLAQSSGAVIVTEATTKCLAEMPRKKSGELKETGAPPKPECFLAARLAPYLYHPYQRHQQRVLFTLDQLTHLPDSGAPRFVFAHIVSPHYPFLFGPKGELNAHLGGFTVTEQGSFSGTRETYLEGYRDQVAFLNGRLIEVIDALLANSATPPVIILQGDHGPDANEVQRGRPSPLPYLVERFSILNAYYLPGCTQGSPAAAGEPYDTISPVNSFRVVFNACFGEDLPLLEDTSYFSTYFRPFDFENVTGQITPPAWP